MRLASHIKPDNSHPSAQAGQSSTRQFIEAIGAELRFLPPYSPDLNPIENIFSKVKQHLRSLACRTREALWQAMQSVLDPVTSTDAAHCFLHCKYTLRVDWERSKPCTSCKFVKFRAGGSHRIIRNL